MRGFYVGVHVTLNPVLITEHSDTFEVIVVQINPADKAIRILTGYGPQDSWELDVKMRFFVALEEEIAKAAIKHIPVILMGDLNSKLGPTYINNDLHTMSGNGNIISRIMERIELIVVSGFTKKCKGLITRERSTVNNIERCIIDLFIVSKDIVEEIVEMLVDDEQKQAPKDKESCGEKRKLP